MPYPLPGLGFVSLTAPGAPTAGPTAGLTFRPGR
jgi:hypothetical protein